MTEKIYMQDCYCQSFDATIAEVTNNALVLDKTAFYPEGGGQPSDRGTLQTETTQTNVVDVQEDAGKIKHIVESTEGFENGKTVKGNIDWDQRYTLMRLHTAQHLLSAVVLDRVNAEVVGNQIHRDEARMDFKPVSFTENEVQKIENACNSYINEERNVTITEMPRKQVEEQITVGRSNLDLIPDHIDPLRVVEIENLDLCPCGGTHVAGLEEIGRMEITDRTRKGEDIDRLRFTINDA